MRIRFDGYFVFRFQVNDILIRCSILGVWGVRCHDAYSQLRTNADPKKGLHRKSGTDKRCPFLASIDNWSISILSNF